MPDPGLFGPATLTVTQGISAFSTFLPKFTDVRKNHPADNPEFAADVRMGEVAAGATCIGIGLICSSLTGSPLPAYTALLTAGVLIVLYETTLRSNRPFEPKTPGLVNLAEVSNA